MTRSIIDTEPTEWQLQMHQVLIIINLDVSLSFISKPLLEGKEQS